MLNFLSYPAGGSHCQHETVQLLEKLSLVVELWSACDDSVGHCFVRLSQRESITPLEAIDRSVQEFGCTLNALGCDLFADGLNLALRNDSVQNGVKKQVSEVRIVPKNSTPTEPTNTDTRRPTNVTNDRALGSNVRIEVSSDGESFSIGAGMRNPSNPPVGMAANAVPESNGAPPK
uniref:Uncharacterized protein n=1 Tax=Anopheles merus TaxID=30066 RepID=A0A182V6G1_ANOME